MQSYFKVLQCHCFPCLEFSVGVKGALRKHSHFLQIQPDNLYFTYFLNIVNKLICYICKLPLTVIHLLRLFIFLTFIFDRKTLGFKL